MSNGLYLLTGIISALISISLQLGSFDCYDNGVDGTYCTDDYTGYHVCTWKGEKGKIYHHEIVKCPSRTRCSCHYRKRCSMKPIEICKSFIEPKPIVDPAIFSFTGSSTTVYHVSNSYQDVVISASGEIRQDMSKKKYMKIYKIHEKRYFSLILPSKSGGYKNYFGNFDEKRCRKWTMHAFNNRQFLGSDLHRYTLMKSNVDNKGTTHQEWSFKQGDDEGQYFNKFWYVSLDSSGKYSKPTKYIEKKFLASEDNSRKTTKITKWTTKYFVPGSSTDQWFKIPDFC